MTNISVPSIKLKPDNHDNGFTFSWQYGFNKSVVTPEFKKL